MRNTKEIVIIILMLLITIGISIAQDNSTIDDLDNFTMDDFVDEEIISIDLDKYEYLVGDEFAGVIKIKLNKTINPETELTFKVFGNQKILTLAQLLENASINFSMLTGLLDKSYPDVAKVLTFASEGSQKIGVVLPGYSQVQSVTMGISGPANNDIYFPKLDIGDDGVIDWYYLGDLLGFVDESTMPVGLNDNQPGSKVYINDNQTLLCQKIDLPFGRHFQVMANYKKTGSLGNMTAVILAPFSGDFRFLQGGEDRCDMIEGSSFGYKECFEPIELSYAAKGEHLVCIFNSEGYSGNEYEVKSDNSDVTTTAYKCVSEFEGDYACEKITNNDFYIKVKGAEYSQYLDKPAEFSNFELGPDATLMAFRKYVGSDDSDIPYLNFNGVCNEPNCLIPINVYVNGSGTIVFSNLNIDYEFEVPQSENTFYSVVDAEPLIKSIKGNSLENDYELVIPLSAFGLLVPSPPITSVEYLEGFINVYYGEEVAKEKITAYVNAIPLGESESLINETRFNIDKMLTGDSQVQLLLTLLDMKSDLTNAQQQLITLENELKTSGTSVAGSVQSLRASLPKEIKFVNEIKDVQFLEPNDITSEVIGYADVNKVYGLQEKVNVQYTITSYSIVDYNDMNLNYKLVNKAVTAKSDLDKIEVVEVIPKEVTYSLTSIKFEQTPMIVKEDPIVKWFVASLKKGVKKDFNYVIETDASVTDNLKTIIILEIPDVVIPKSECGDLICESDEDEISCPVDCKVEEKSSFGFYIIVLIVILLLVGLGFVGVKMGWISFAKSPFKDEKEMNTVISFVKKIKDTGKSDEEVKKMLLGKSWKVEQVDYAIKQSNKVGVEKKQNEKV